MAFLVFERVQASRGVVLRPTGEHYQLAGRHLLRKAWESQGRPIERGWHARADDLIKLLSDGAHGYDTRRLVIDFHPTAKHRIGLIEILDIYAYTHASAPPSEPGWTPLMLRLRDVFYEEYDADVTSRKDGIIAELLERPEEPDFVEFLYLQDKDWNWGRNGSTNAAFLQGNARKYFREFF